MFKNRQDLTLIILIFLLIAISFIIGVIFGSKYINRPNIRIYGEKIDVNQILTASNKTGQGSGLFFASKSGKYYYLNGCKTNIKEENKIWFNSEIEAQGSGYLKSGSC